MVATPANRLFLECVNEENEVVQIPAIDEQWANADEDGSGATGGGRWPLFRTLTTLDHLAVQSWLKEMSQLEAGVVRLRRLPYHRFWSSVLFDAEVLHVVHSFLTTYPRLTETDVLELMCFGKSKEVNEMMNRLYRHMFGVILRLGTPKETKEDYLDDEYFADVLLNHPVFTVERIMDVVAVYHNDNATLVEKFLACLLRLQPKYEVKFRESAQKLVKIFDRCGAKVEKLFVGRDAGGRVAAKRTNLEKATIVELCCFFVDSTWTLRCLFVASPKVCSIFYEAGTTSSLVALHSRVYDCLYTELTTSTSFGGFDNYKKHMLGRLLAFSQFCCIAYWLLTNPTREKVLKGGDAGAVQDYLRHMREVYRVERLGLTLYKTFRLDMEADLETFSRRAITTVTAADDGGTVKEVVLADELRSLLKDAKKRQCFKIVAELHRDGHLKDIEIVDRPRLISLVSHVKDILPELSDEYIHLCLRHYKYSAEDTIDQLLGELNKSGVGDMSKVLPHQLAGCVDVVRFRDWLPTSVVEPTVLARSTPSEESSDEELLAAATSAYLPSANDEQTTNENGLASLVPLTVGKKHESSSRGRGGVVEALSELAVKGDLEADREKERLLQFYAKFDHETAQDEEHLYEDEYDDTYDWAMTTAADDTTPSEFRIRPLNRRGFVPAAATAQESSAAEESGGRQEEQTSQSRLDNRSGAGQKPQSSNYTGGRLRQLKERNKDQFAHHNRKRGAQAKMNKGMF